MADKNNVSDKDTNVTQKNNNGMQKTILASVLILAVAGVAIAYILTQKDDAIAETPEPTGIPILTEENTTDIRAGLEEKVAKSMFETHMNNEWTFPDGTSASIDAVMGNSPNNNYPFYFTVTLSDGREVFKSNLLPVGSQISEIILTEDLDAGRYPAIVSVSMVDENNEPVESNLGFNVELIVQA